MGFMSLKPAHFLALISLCRAPLSFVPAKPNNVISVSETGACNLRHPSVSFCKNLHLEPGPSRLHKFVKPLFWHKRAIPVSSPTNPKLMLAPIPRGAIVLDWTKLPDLVAVALL